MTNEILQGDVAAVLKTLPDESVDCCITSPPYFGLRDYQAEGQLGREKTPEEYVARMVEVFRGVRRVMKKEGTLWLNLGDSYAVSTKGGGGKQNTNVGSLGGVKRFKAPEGMKPKDIIGIPWMTAFALRADGWYLRQDIIWAKPSPMPESVQDRFCKSHEYIFLLSKSPRYYFDLESVKEPTIDNGFRNKRSVWTIATHPYADAHFATFPEKLIEPMVLAGCPKGGIILDPFVGSGTTAVVAKKLGRNYIGIDINEKYCEMARRRIAGTPSPML